MKVVQALPIPTIEMAIAQQEEMVALRVQVQWPIRQVRMYVYSRHKRADRMM